MDKIKIKIPIYDADCTVIIDSDINSAIQKYGKRNKWEQHWFLGEKDRVHGYAVPDFSLFYSKEHLSPNLISHEVSHLVDFILEEKGIELTGETRAYITGHISEKIFEYAIKHNLLKWEKDLKKSPKVKKPKEKKDEKSSGLLQENNQNPGGIETGIS